MKSRVIRWVTFETEWFLEMRFLPLISSVPGVPRGFCQEGISQFHTRGNCSQMVFGAIPARFALLAGGASGVSSDHRSSVRTRD